MKRGRRRKMFRFLARMKVAPRERSALDEIVTICIETSAPTRAGFGTPLVVSSEPPTQRVRWFKHWTDLYLSGIGTERQITRAKKWVKRHVRARRKARRGWA